MDIKTIKVGYLSTNCYFLTKDNNTIVVDPGDELEKLLDVVKENNLNIIGYLITHHHNDHIGALSDMLMNCNAPVYDIKNMKEGINTINNFEFEVIYTKGHTNDSISIYFKDDKLMLTGDFLFRDTIGRYDLETSSFIDMKESINKIKKYDSDITIYPGHGSKSNLGYEKENNNYLKAY